MSKIKIGISKVIGSSPSPVSIDGFFPKPKKLIKFLGVPGIGQWFQAL